MSHKAKPAEDHYKESFIINSAALGKQLALKSVHQNEIEYIMKSLSHIYFENVDRIVQECSKDIMALERFSSPLKLFIEVINKFLSDNILMPSTATATATTTTTETETAIETKSDSKTYSLSPPSISVLKSYAQAWEEWMY